MRRLALRLLFYVAVMPPACLTILLIGIAYVLTDLLPGILWPLFKATNRAAYALRDALWGLSRRANGCVAELRDGGIQIDCRQSSASGERVWLYSLDLSNERTARLEEEYRQLSLFREDADAA